MLAVPFFSLRSLRYKNMLMESEKTEKYDRKQRSWILEVRTISGDMICWQGSCTIQTKVVMYCMRTWKTLTSVGLITRSNLRLDGNKTDPK